MNKPYIYEQLKLNNGYFEDKYKNNLGNKYTLLSIETATIDSPIEFLNADITVVSSEFTGSLLDYIISMKNFSLLVDKKTNKVLKILAIKIPTGENFYSVSINENTFFALKNLREEELRTMYITSDCLGQLFRRGERFDKISLFTIGSTNSYVNLILNQLRLEIIKNKIISIMRVSSHNFRLFETDDRIIVLDKYTNMTSGEYEQYLKNIEYKSNKQEKYSLALLKYIANIFNSDRSIETFRDIVPTLYYGYINKEILEEINKC